MLRAPARRQPDADSGIVYIGSSFKKIWVPEGAKPLPAQGVSWYSAGVRLASHSQRLFWEQAAAIATAV